MVNMVSTISAIVVHSFIIVLALETVKAYVPYVPASNDIEYDNDVDVQPYQRSSADPNVFYRYLNSLLLDNFINRHMSGSSDKFTSLKALKRVPSDEDRRESSMEKRKVFWQPLGYLPAGVHPSGNQGPSAGGGSAGRGQVFRYGK